MNESGERNDTPLSTRRVEVYPVGGFATRRRKFPWRGVALFLVAGALGAGGVMLWQSRNALPSSITTSDSQSILKKEKQIEDETTAARQREKIAVAQAKLQQVLDEGEKTLGLLSVFDAELAAWDTNVKALLTDDRGRFLAADETYVIAFKTLFNSRRPNKSDGAAVGRRVETLMEPIRVARSSENAAYTPSEDALSKFQQERKAIEALIAAYHEPRMQVEGLLAQATKTKTPAASTLEDAIRDLDARQAEEQARKIAAAKETERKKADDALAAAKAGQVAQEAKDQVARIDAEKEAARKRAEIEEKKLREAVEREQRAKLAQNDEVKRLLAPFISPGLWQPNKKPGQSVDMAPVSYSGLQMMGALEPTGDGLQRLLTAATKPPETRSSHDKIRPRWGYPIKVKVLTPDQLEEIKKAQQYLRELGPTMVELKMLSP